MNWIIFTGFIRRKCLNTIYWFPDWKENIMWWSWCHLKSHLKNDHDDDEPITSTSWKRRVFEHSSLSSRNHYHEVRRKYRRLIKIECKEWIQIYQHTKVDDILSVINWPCKELSSYKKQSIKFWIRINYYRHDKYFLNKIIVLENPTRL